MHLAASPAAAPVAAPYVAPYVAPAPAAAPEPAPRMSTARRDLLCVALAALVGAVEPEARPAAEGQALRPVGPRAQG